MFDSQQQKTRLGKFDARSDEGIAVGYFMHGKTYCVYNKRTRIIEDSTHIVFEEYNDGTLRSSSFQELKLSRYDDELDESGNVVGNKARLVIKGYNQEEGVDFDKTSAPVARLDVSRILLAFASCIGIKIFQMDVKCSFLNGFLQEEAYIEQPPFSKILIFLIMCSNDKKPFMVWNKPVELGMVIEQILTWKWF